MRYVFIALLVVIALAGAILSGMIAFGTAAPPPPLASLDQADVAIGEGLEDYPAAEFHVARDGARLAFRRYEGQPGAGLVVLVHGSSGNARAVHGLARALASAGMTVIAPDIRGHGESRPGGDIAYLGQLDDDMADLADALDAAYPAERRVLAGHSSGGGFALRIAGGQGACAFDGFLALSPYLQHQAPTTRPGTGGWARPYRPRIIGLSILNRFGLHAFNHLPVVAFALPPDAGPGRTGTYSFRLMRNFGLEPQEWEDSIRRINRPTVILVGDGDELFYADQFEPTLAALQPAIRVQMVRGPDHMGIVLDPRAHAVIVTEAAALLGQEPSLPRCGPERRA
jgi:non-heme chloroperoxidase